MTALQPLYAWSPATDTTEIASVFRGRPLAEQPTVELLLPLRPLPARLSPRAGAGSRHFLRRLRSYGWLVGLLLAVVVCVAVPLLTRGHYVAWDGAHEIPTAVTR